MRDTTTPIDFLRGRVAKHCALGAEKFDEGKEDKYAVFELTDDLGND
jgi:hypothetical protein